MIVWGVLSFGFLFWRASSFSLCCAFSWSWRDFTCIRRSAVCFVVHSVIRPFSVGWDTGGSFWIAAAMRWAVVRRIEGVVAS